MHPSLGRSIESMASPANHCSNPPWLEQIRVLVSHHFTRVVGLSESKVSPEAIHVMC